MTDYEQIPITSDRAEDICGRCGLYEALLVGRRVCARGAQITAVAIRDGMGASPEFKDAPLDTSLPHQTMDGTTVIRTNRQMLMSADLAAFNYGEAAVACAAVRQQYDRLAGITGSSEPFAPTETFSAEDIVRAAAP